MGRRPDEIAFKDNGRGTGDNRYRQLPEEFAGNRSRATGAWLECVPDQERVVGLRSPRESQLQSLGWGESTGEHRGAQMKAGDGRVSGRGGHADPDVLRGGKENRIFRRASLYTTTILLRMLRS